MNTITFKTRTQAVIFKNEILGQISDGMWENTPGTDWRTWCHMQVFVCEQTGRSCQVRKDGFALHRLIEYVGERMILQAKLALAYPDMSLTMLDMLEGFQDVARILERTPDSRYWQQVKAAVDALGGRDDIQAKLDTISYTERNLRNDLTAIKQAMKETL